MSFFDKWKTSSTVIPEKIIDDSKQNTHIKSTKITQFLSNNNSLDKQHDYKSETNKMSIKKSTSYSNVSKQEPTNNSLKIINIPNSPSPSINITSDVKIIKEPPKYLDIPNKSDISDNSNKSVFDELIYQDKSINVYTDGSCINNGRPNAKAGIGIYFGENDPRNISTPVKGKQTNNVAELTAIIMALNILKNEINEGKRIIVYSDSEYAIKCLTSYGRKLEKKCFITNDPIPNIELIKEGLLKVKSNVYFQHIRSHTGKQDPHSLANEEADKLANKAIGIENKAPRYYLKVSYGNRDMAKQLGAKWDGKKKCWYVMNLNHKAVQVFGTLE